MSSRTLRTTDVYKGELVHPGLLGLHFETLCLGCSTKPKWVSDPEGPFCLAVNSYQLQLVGSSSFCLSPVFWPTAGTRVSCLFTATCLVPGKMEAISWLQVPRPRLEFTAYLEGCFCSCQSGGRIDAASPYHPCCLLGIEDLGTPGTVKQKPSS